MDSKATQPLEENKKEPEIKAEQAADAEVTSGKDLSMYNCSDCSGEGLLDAKTLCPTCNGKGKVG